MQVSCDKGVTIHIGPESAHGSGRALITVAHGGCASRGFVCCLDAERELRVAFRLFTLRKEPNAHPKPLSPFPLADARHPAVDIGRGKVHPLHVYDRTMQRAIAEFWQVRDLFRTGFEERRTRGWRQRM